MCLSPDEMTSAELEELVAYYRSFSSPHLDERADELEKLLKERAENGTYDVVPTATPRHAR